MTDTTCHRWYLVQSQPHAESKARAHLERQGYTIYLPRYLKRRRHARRVETVAVPIFPRYLFVAIDASKQGWSSIRSTVGVSSLVCNGDIPAEVPRTVIDSLRNREADGYVMLEPAARYNVGDSVRILDGAFANCLGLYEGMPDQQRVAVLLDMLGRKVRVLVDELFVAAA